MTGETKLDETYIFRTSIKMRFFYVAIGIKIPSFRVLVTIEPGHSLLQFITLNCLKIKFDFFLDAILKTFAEDWAIQS